jgi:plasmid stabilization system protein ParE
MAKFKIEWSVDARLDLFDILEFFLKRNGSSAYSIRLNKSINKNIQHLSKNPFLGIQTDYESVRTLISGEFQIIYEIIEDTILIIMVWDLRRNPEEKNLGRRVR